MVPRKHKDFKHYIFKFVIPILTIIFSAIIGWYINYKLSNLDPIIAISNIEFFYDFKGEKELLELPVSLLNIDNKGFFNRNLKYFMNLDDLTHFTNVDRIKIIESKYNNWEKQLLIFTRIISDPNSDADLIGKYFLDFIKSGGYDGIAAFLYFLEEKDHISKLHADLKKIEKLTLKDGSIKITNNLYFLSDAWTKKATKVDQKFKAPRIEFLSKKLLYNILEKNYPLLIEYLKKCSHKMKELKKLDIEAEKLVLKVIEDNARKYKKIKLTFQIVNRSDFPIIIYPDCSLSFSDESGKDVFNINGRIQELKSNKSLIIDKDIYNVNIINSKANNEFAVKSVDVDFLTLNSIKAIYDRNHLRSKIKLKIKRYKATIEEYSTDWVYL